jgi:hypothetical protein
VLVRAHFIEKHSLTNNVSVDHFVQISNFSLPRGRDMPYVSSVFTRIFAFRREKSGLQSSHFVLVNTGEQR